MKNLTKFLIGGVYASTLSGFVLAIGLLPISAQAQSMPGTRTLTPNQEPAIFTGSPKMNTINIIDKRIQRTHRVMVRGTQIEQHTFGKIGVEGAGQKTTQTGLREVWAQLRNLTDYTQVILVRTTWYDAQEAPVDGPSAWDRIHFPQNGGEIYRTQSVHPDAEYFYIEVQEVHR
jgi:hypothetical protein